ncbi:hypothetical protein ACFRNT_30290 [Streptomyces sp. NPDC056697]|uniref:hypothetical protein n=1 Tax=Streptomyces sp. NPDC056697 TaxID=3345915 RepID=UPI00368E651A
MRAAASADDPVVSANTLAFWGIQQYPTGNPCGAVGLIDAALTGCLRRFALGHGHRKDSVYCRPACRQAAYQARKAQERVAEGAPRLPQ